MYEHDDRNFVERAGAERLNERPADIRWEPLIGREATRHSPAWTAAPGDLAVELALEDDRELPKRMSLTKRSRDELLDRSAGCAQELIQNLVVRHEPSVYHRAVTSGR